MILRIKRTIDHQVMVDMEVMVLTEDMVAMEVMVLTEVVMVGAITNLYITSQCTTSRCITSQYITNQRILLLLTRNKITTIEDSLSIEGEEARLEEWFVTEYYTTQRNNEKDVELCSKYGLSSPRLKSKHCPLNFSNLCNSRSSNNKT